MENELNNQVPKNSEETKGVCNFDYLNEMMGNKKELVKEIIEVFIGQVPDELKALNSAVEKNDFAVIKSLSHTIKSSVSIMGINTATPILQAMESLAKNSTNIKEITELNESLQLICNQAVEEINLEMIKYK